VTSNNPGPSDDPYHELGVAFGSDRRAIRAAYLAKARRLHPDRGGEVGGMARLNAAYELLSDPQRRAAYDTSPDAAARRQRAAEPWTGIAGPPPGRPSGAVLDFGIFAGWSLGEIAGRDPGYLVWLAEHKQGRAYAAEIDRLLGLNRASGAPAAAARRHR
jgi:curved DNA-binding protein CbpA